MKKKSHAKRTSRSSAKTKGAFELIGSVSEAEIQAAIDGAYAYWKPPKDEKTKK